MSKTPDQYTTRCRLCGHTFTAQPFKLDIFGQARIERFFGVVSGHIQEKHADYLAAATIAAYTTEDPALLQIAEAARGSIHKGTRKNHATDAEIIDRISRAGFNREEIERLTPVLYQMRDFLTEQGNYAPPAPPKR